MERWNASPLVFGGEKLGILVFFLEIKYGGDYGYFMASADWRAMASSSLVGMTRTGILEDLVVRTLTGSKTSPSFS